MPARKRSYQDGPQMGGDSSKRVRFNSEDIADDDVTEFDFPNRKARRGAVKDTDGYHSDSSGDEEGPRGRVAAANADDEDDMFGSTAAGGAKTGLSDLDAKDNDTRVKDSGLQLANNAGKGGKEFLELGDIEGQEFGSTEAAGSAHREARLPENQRRKVFEDQEDYVEGEEHANDDDAVVPKERKSQEGLGFAISRFNMKEEMEEGRFSADGTYEANAKDPDAVHDQWLTALSASDIEAAAKAKQKHDSENAEREAQEASKALSRIDCIKAILQSHDGLVKPGETVQSALARLGKVRKAEQAAEKEQQKRDRRAAGAAKPKKDFDAPSPSADAGMPVDHATSMNGKGKVPRKPASAVSEAIDVLTSLASIMLNTYGETAIYEESHEGMIRQLIAEGEVPRNWKPVVEQSSIESDSLTKHAETNTQADAPKQRRGVVSRPLIARP